MKLVKIVPEVVRFPSQPLPSRALIELRQVLRQDASTHIGRLAKRMTPLNGFTNPRGS